MTSFLRGALKVALFVAVPIAVILFVLKLTYVDIVTVAHNGMAPTLFSGDEVLLWRGAAANLGDIMVCEHPREPGRYVMARVIALPGTSLSVERGSLVIGRDVPMHDYRGEVSFDDPTRDSRRLVRWGVETLGADRYYFFEDTRHPLRIRPIESLSGLYLVGDHRGYSGEDSREFGVVQASTCVGQVFMLMRPGPQSIDALPRHWFSLLGP